MKKNIYQILCLTLLLLCYNNTYSQVTQKQETATQMIIEPGDCPDPIRWYFDGDNDGLGDPTDYQLACTKPPGQYVTNGNDCDDSVSSTTSIWYYDGDKDGYGSASNPMTSCTQPAYYVDNNEDCDDSNANINPTTKWYINIDTNGDGILSDLDGNAIVGCTKPAGNYSYTTTDKTNHWIHQVTYDIKGITVGSTRSYFDDLSKPDLSLSKDYVTNKIWGTETIYDDFGRPDKTSFIAPSPLSNFDKTNFFKTQAEINASSISKTQTIATPITSSTTINAIDEIIASSAISTGLTVNFNSNAIILKPGFSVTASSGSSFKASIVALSDNSPATSLANYYSDINTDELYQATATHPFAQTNYDSLNPGSVINVVGGNRINGEWRTGYSYTVPAAQEMYYVYGSDYYDGTITAGKEEVITKFYKSVGVDANGNENVSFTDGEGKLLASARSGGAASYPVVSLIGTQGFVDVHIPTGISSGQIALIGSSSLYKIYDLKTGALTTTLTGGNAYRIQAITTPTSDPKTYIASGAPTYDAGSLGITYRVNYYDYAVNVYNKTGQLVKSIQPNGYVSNTTVVASPAYMTSTNFASTYKYNTLGQLIESSSPDEGISKFAYRNDEQIRYSQIALQADTNVSYTDYDDLGRPKESGVITGSSGIWATAAANSNNTSLITGTRSEQSFIIYDYPENNTTSVVLPTTPTNLTLAGVLVTAGISSTNYTQNNLSGNVAITYTKPGSTISAITWYSYDPYDRVEWLVQYNEGIGAKTIHYEYDYKGNIKKVLFQKDKTAELFVHQYTYNANNVLTKVETSTNNSTFTTHADYSYYKTGELKRVNIAQGAQGLDYVYTLGGQLKSINHPSLEASKDPGGDTNDVFGLTLDYYNGDYLRTSRNITSSPTAGADYNGNIKAARWANKGIAGDYSGSTANQKGYLYNYNRNNWLTGATFGNTNSSTAVISPITGLAEGGLTYDANGNIQTLQRTNDAGTIVDKLTYNYTNTGTNQLNSITESAAVTADVTDIENQSAGNYVYDAVGQLKQNVSENLYYFYNTQGLVTEVKKGSNTIVKFFYNERGQRIKKESYNTTTFVLQNTTYYQLDLSGNTMAVYSLPNGGSITQVELAIYGLNRLGIYKKASGISSYEIKDHLGNVRAVIEKESGLPAIKSFADYYPFGELLPSRNSLNYRYAFQGQELDTETGMEAFQLRLWDGRIGRWLSTDPYGQYASPYLGMGNNPISSIDPDGGFTEDCCPDPSELNEVVVFGKSKSDWQDIFNDFTKQMAVFNANYFGTIATNNMTFGLVQAPHAFTGTKYEAAERFGRLGGDITTMVQGVGEDIVAVGAEVFSFGTLTVPAGAVAIHGSTVALGSAYATGGEVRGLVDYFARRGSGSSGNGGNGGNKNPPRAFNKAKAQAESGNLQPRNIYQGRENPRWAGAEEYDVPESPAGDRWRVLKLTKNGKVIWGYTEQHYEAGTIHLFPGSSW